MNRSYVIAAVLLLATVGWMASGQLKGATDHNDPANKDTAAIEAAKTQNALALPRVRVVDSVAKPWLREVKLRGKTEAVRSVELKSEVVGRIAKLHVEQGSLVKQGDLIVEIAADDRLARMEQARAQVRLKQMEFEASNQLMIKGYRAKTQTQTDLAELEAARATVKAMEVELRNTAIRAPFDGVLEDRTVTIGSFVQEGTMVALLIDSDPMLIVGHVSEQEVYGLRIGAKGSARLINGDVVEGKVRFISTRADDQTRTFKVELEVPNENGAIRDGTSAEMVLPIATLPAHQVSPAIVTLSDKGEMGVRLVDPAGKVQFQKVQIVGSEPAGVWITGLSANARIITVGQDFVVDGQAVEVVEEKIKS